MANKTFALTALILVTACATTQNEPPAVASAESASEPSEAAPSPAEEPASETAEFWTSPTPCAEGAELKGAAPPEGALVYCELAGKPHGPKVTFHKNGQ